MTNPHAFRYLATVASSARGSHIRIAFETEFLAPLDAPCVSQ